MQRNYTIPSTPAGYAPEQQNQHSDSERVFTQLKRFIGNDDNELFLNILQPNTHEVAGLTGEQLEQLHQLSLNRSAECEAQELEGAAFIQAEIRVAIINFAVEANFDGEVIERLLNQTPVNQQQKDARTQPDAASEYDDDAYAMQIQNEEYAKLSTCFDNNPTTSSAEDLDPSAFVQEDEKMNDENPQLVASVKQMISGSALARKPIASNDDSDDDDMRIYAAKAADRQIAPFSPSAPFNLETDNRGERSSDWVNPLRQSAVPFVVKNPVGERVSSPVKPILKTALQSPPQPDHQSVPRTKLQDDPSVFSIEPSTNDLVGEGYEQRLFPLYRALQTSNLKTLTSQLETLPEISEGQIISLLAFTYQTENKGKKERKIEVFREKLFDVYVNKCRTKSDTMHDGTIINDFYKFLQYSAQEEAKIVDTVKGEQDKPKKTPGELYDEQIRLLTNALNRWDDEAFKKEFDALTKVNQQELSVRHAMDLYLLSCQMQADGASAENQPANRGLIVENLIKQDKAFVFDWLCDVGEQLLELESKRPELKTIHRNNWDALARALAGSPALLKQADFEKFQQAWKTIIQGKDDLKLSPEFAAKLLIASYENEQAHSENLGISREHAKVRHQIRTYLKQAIPADTALHKFFGQDLWQSIETAAKNAGAFDQFL